MEDEYSPWTGIDPGALHVVTDANQASIVGDPVRSRFLHPFLGREVSVTRAAAETGCTPNAMLYRVRRMLDAQLLRVTETQLRAGRPIKIYRSSHDGYFVPTHVMHYDDLRHRVSDQGRRLAADVVDAYTAVLFGSGNSGRVLARDGLGDVWSSDLPPVATDRGQPVLMTDVQLELTAEEATDVREAFASAIGRVRRAVRVRATDHASTSAYLLSCAVLPLADRVR